MSPHQYGELDLKIPFELICYRDNCSRVAVLYSTVSHLKGTWVGMISLISLQGVNPLTV